MKIYEYETQAGLEEKIQKDTSIAFTCDINFKDTKHSVDDLDEKTIAKMSGNPNQKDLFYLESVLVSTNWNGNDDVFTRDEVWAARNTPVDKQFNYMHNEKDIIGHITSSYIVDKEGNEISSSLNIEEVPSFFDIVVGSVIYKKWTDESLKERMEQIIEDIKANKKFVSMEALFTNFDYAVIGQDRSIEIIQRNEKTSFLTKALRCYGGNGVYENYRIGRLLRNLTFSGKGLVDNPANKRSHIKSYSFSGTQASLKKEFGSNLMDNVSKAEYDAQKDRLDEVKAELEKVRAEVEALKSDKQTLAEELKNEKALSEQRSEKIEKLEAMDKEQKEKMKEKEDESKKMKAEIIKRDRITQLVSAGVDSEKASELADKFASANDEMFGEVVALQKSLKSNSQTEASEEETEEAEASAADKGAQALENAEEEEDTSAASFNDDTDNDMHTVASEYLTSVLENK